MEVMGLAGAAIAALAVIGWAIIRLIWRDQARWSVYEQAPLAFALGAGWVSLVMFGLSLLGAPAFGITCVLSALVCAIALLVWLKHPAAHATTRLPDPDVVHPTRVMMKTILRFGLMGLLAWTVLIVTVGALQSDLGWMGLAIWGIKARAAFLAGRMPLDYFSDLSRQWSHLNYPLLFPLTETWLYQFMGQVNERAVKVLFPITFIGLIALFYGALRQNFSSEFGLLFTVWLATIPGLMFEAIIGDADVLLTLFVFGSTLYLFRWFSNGLMSDLVLAAVLSALGAWVKNEGMIHWMVNLLALPIFGCLCRKRCPVGLGKVLAVFVVVTFVLLGPWQIFLRLQRVPDNDFAPVAFGTALANASRIPTIVASLVAHFLTLQYWGSFWLMFFVALGLSGRKMRFDPARGYLALAVLLPLGLLAFAFLFSVWEPFTLHMDAALPRLMLHTVPTAAFFVALQCEGLDRFINELGSQALYVS